MTENLQHPYARYRVLTDHDAQCLQVGDLTELPWQSSGQHRVIDVERKRTGSRRVQLSNGFSFDPSSEAWGNSLRSLIIWRPLNKFRPFHNSSTAPKQDDTEGLSVKKSASKKPARKRAAKKS